MNIELIDQFDKETLIKKVREVPLLNDESIKVYKDSNIRIAEVFPAELNLPKLTMLKENLKFQDELRNYLLQKYKIDTFRLEGGITLRNNKSEIWTMIPPVVEVSEELVLYVPRKKSELEYKESHRLNIPVVADGGHRVFLARKLNLSINVIYISNIDVKYPYYAHPNGWDSIEEVDQTVSKKKKKLHVQENSYDLYRNLNVLGCGGPREEGSTKY